MNDDIFTQDFYNKLQNILDNIFQHNFNLKDQNSIYQKFFSDLIAIKGFDKYYIADNYNSFQDEQCIENDFLRYYYDVLTLFQEGQKQMNLKDYEMIIDNPEVIH